MVVLFEAGEVRDVAGDGAADLHGSAFAAGRAARQVRKRGADKGKDRHAGVNEAGSQGGIDDQVVTTFGGKAVVLIHPCGGDTHGGKQGVDPRVMLAIVGRDIQRGQKRPGGNTHGERNNHDEREQLGAREQIAGVAARVGSQEMLGAGELLPAGQNDVVEGEEAALIERQGVVLFFACVVWCVGKSHSVLCFWLQRKHYRA